MEAVCGSRRGVLLGGLGPYGRSIGTSCLGRVEPLGLRAWLLIPNCFITYYVSLQNRP